MHENTGVNASWGKAAWCLTPSRRQHFHPAAVPARLPHLICSSPTPRSFLFQSPLRSSRIFLTERTGVVLWHGGEVGFVNCWR